MLPNDLQHLDASLLAAHASKDTAALIVLYTRAADWYETSGNIDAACFHLTHAYIFALHEGDRQAANLHARLLANGREE